MPILNLDKEIELDNNDIDKLIPKKVDKEENYIQSGKSIGGVALGVILGESIKSKASDIHLTVGYPAKLRINGSLFELATPPLTENIIIGYIKEILSGKNDLVKKGNIYNLDLSFSSHGRRFRVNIFKQMGYYSIVLRVIPDVILSMDDLALPTTLKNFVNLPSGLVLVTGPTGSGKSTPLASILNVINYTQRKHIITLEDPIEFIYPKALAQVEQRERYQDFAEWNDALRSILRQDPDVVLLGEMRDFETIASAITIAETGHLVFATLHTNSASQSIDRIIDVFPEFQQNQIRSQLSSVLSAIVSQRLLKSESLEIGRVPAFEILIANSAVKNNIREGQTHQIDSVIQTGSNLGMISMEMSLANLYKSGKISLQVAMESTLKPRELELIINK